MLKKSYSKTGQKCRVTFKLANVEAETAAVLGEWNDWDASRHPLKRRKDGTWSATVSVDAGRSYRFRYLIDASEWQNDEEADGLAPNRFGGRDGLLAV